MIVLALVTAAGLWVLLILKPVSWLNKDTMSPCEKNFQTLKKRLEANGLKKQTGETHTSYIKRACLKWPQYSSELRTLIHSYNTGVYSSEGSDTRQHLDAANQMKQALSQIRKLS